jgi:SAM-dependent methyltransferase
MSTDGRARYDAMADFYESVTGNTLDDPATAGLLAVLPPVGGKRILDLACGHGRVTRELGRRGAAVTGIDVSLALVERARAAEASERVGATYVHADATQPGALGQQGFDGIVCNHALADIDDLEGALAEVERVLDVGGFFAFSLLHPCFPGWGTNAPSSWPPGDGYYRERWWLADNPGFRGKVGANHRMLSTYLNALARRGLVVEQVLEPAPRFEEWSTDRPDADPVPAFLVVRCVKRGGGLNGPSAFP